MSKHDTLTEYFRRARTDAGFRAHLMENARYMKSASGWGALVFAILAVGPAVFDGLRYGVWISSTCIFSTISCAFCVLVREQFGDRVAMLMSMDEVPIALFMAGNTTTLPIRIFTTIEFDFGGDIMAISALIVIVSFMLMLVLDRLVGLERVLGSKQ